MQKKRILWYFTFTELIRSSRNLLILFVDTVNMAITMTAIGIFELCPLKLQEMPQNRHIQLVRHFSAPNIIIFAWNLVDIILRITIDQVQPKNNRQLWVLVLNLVKNVKIWLNQLWFLLKFYLIFIKLYDNLDENV